MRRVQIKERERELAFGWKLMTNNGKEGS